MSKAAWLACRTATAIAITLLIVLVFRPEQPFRSVLAAGLTVCLPTFRGKAMRQRLLLVWATGIMGMMLDAFFREAPWLYLGFFVMMASGLLILASRSRDLATLTLVAYGLSGSLPSEFDPQSMSILEGFYRSLNITIGMFASAVAFLIFPLRKPPSTTLAKRINFPVRDTLFIALAGALSIILSKLFTGTIISTFCVFGSLTWGIKLCTQSGEALLYDITGRVLGLLVAITFVIVVCFSTNNPVPYVIGYAGVAWLTIWMSYTYPRYGVLCTNLLIVFSATALMIPEPFHSFLMPLQIAFSLFMGMGCTTIVWLIDRPLRAVEGVAQTNPAGC